MHCKLITIRYQVRPMISANFYRRWKSETIILYCIYVGKSIERDKRLLCVLSFDSNVNVYNAHVTLMYLIFAAFRDLIQLIHIEFQYK